MQKLGLKKLFHNSAGTLVRQLGAGVLQLLTVIAIARVLGPAGNGQFAIALLLPTLLYSFLEMGMPTANAHFISSEQVSVRTAFDTSLRWSTILIPAGLAIGILSVWLAGDQWFPGVPASTLWLALTIYPVLLLQTFIASIFQGLQDFKAYNWVLLLQPAVTLALSLGIIAVGMGTATALIGAYLLGAVVTLIVSYKTLRRYFSQRRTERGAVRAYSRQITHYALKSHISIALAFFNYRVDVYLLNLLGNTAETGVYVIATQMVEKLWLLSAAVSVVMLPLLSQLTAEEDKRRRITPLLYIWVFLLTGVAGVATGLIAGPLIALLFGAGYESAATIIRLLLPGIVAWSGARVLAQDIVARGKPELNIYMNGGVLLINVIGNMILIPNYGGNGAAIATTVAYCLFAVQMLFFYSRIARTRWKPAIIDSLKFSQQKLEALLR